MLFLFAVMADPAKPISLQEPSAAAGVNISIPTVDPKSAKAMKKKKMKAATMNKPSASGGQGPTGESRE